MQVSQEAGQVVWYSHLFQNFPQFIVIHTVKGFGVVNKAEIDVFPTSTQFSMIGIQGLLQMPSLNRLGETFLQTGDESFPVLNDTGALSPWSVPLL